MSIQKFIVNGDEAKIDYEGLENRPFGVETESTFISEITKDCSEIAIPDQAYTPTSVETTIGVLEEGETYIVQFDGVEYECVCFAGSMESMGSVLGIGNIDLIQSPSSGPET